MSNCCSAWLKYLPSVLRAALLREMIAVPAEPENPEMNSAAGVSRKCGSMGGRGTTTDLGGHHRAQCTRSCDCLQRGQLKKVGKHQINGREMKPYYIHPPCAAASTAAALKAVQWYPRYPSQPNSVDRRQKRILNETSVRVEQCATGGLSERRALG